MADDDLHAPLTRKAAKRPRRAPPVALAGALVAVPGLFVAAFALWALMADDPLGGEPRVVVAAAPVLPPQTASTQTSAGLIHVAPQQPRSLDEPGTPARAASATPPGKANTVTIIDGSTGERKEVAIPGARNSRAPDSQASNGPAGEPRLQDSRAPIDPRLIEPSRHGPIPKIGPDGATPAKIYGRAATARPGTARVAIVVGGLGIGTALTRRAIETLPAPVTLAFSPYGGTETAKAATQARAQGHETLLEAPMEPADYPDSDPGPQALLTSLTPAQNLDRLQWLMSRFQGYVGIVNMMGGRFSANAPALTPVLRDIARRGLIYLDNGASPRSLAASLAGTNGMPFARAEIVLDAVPATAHIDAALSKLEATARTGGSAIGIAAASPATIERIAQWAKDAQSRGITLVPITAVAIKPQSS